jgi:hypothetical protein
MLFLTEWVPAFGLKAESDAGRELKAIYRLLSSDQKAGDAELAVTDDRVADIESRHPARMDVKFHDTGVLVCQRTSATLR